MEKVKKTAKFNKDYLKSVAKDVFLKDHKHLSHLPLAEIWEEANPKTTANSNRPSAPEQK